MIEAVPSRPLADPTRSAAFSSRLGDAFELAARRAGGVVDRWFEVVGQRLRLCFAGDALLPSLTPAFGHLERPPAHRADLTIFVWDGASTGVPLPPPPLMPDAYIPGGGICEGDDPSIRICWEPDRAALSQLDLSVGAATFRLADARRVRAADVSAPFRLILHWWLSAQGHQVMHAGAVGTRDGAVLLAGRGGSGKTTTALSCLIHGHGYLGDDYCLLQVDPVTPRVWSLYATAKLDADGRRRFGAVVDPVAVRLAVTEDKVPLVLGRAWHERLVVTAPIRAILLPRVTGGARTRLFPATPADSLRALAPSTMFQLLGGRRQAFARVAALVKQVPAFVLAVGDDLLALPDLVESCLEAAPASEPGGRRRPPV